MLEFVEWYAGLAQPGETALIVRQKPQLDEDGKLQYHKDGAIKCTWPAMLPSKWKPGLPMYGNTGLFIIDRFANGKPSASAANVEYCGCMVLDDIGTKSQIPPLPPTWRIETSPGSEQWGYVFSTQPTKGDFAAAILAIAEAGYTDRGAINPVRNFRLPGSINIKPGKGDYAAKLLEWHPDREFVLEDICKALDVTPGPSSTAQHRSMQVMDDGKDEVVAWLSAQGMVLERPNGSGWMGVTCPNAAEHTDGNPMGRYNPVHRAYSCLHSHCHDWSSSRYLAWVKEQGGPDVVAGVREELVTVTMAGVEAKLQEAKQTQGSQFSEASEAMARIAAVEQAELGRLERNEWFSRFAYIREEDAYFDMKRRIVISRAAFNALYRHIDTKSIHGNRARVVASISYDELRQSSGAKVLDSLTYAAGEGELVADSDGLVYGNRWANARPCVRGAGASDADVSLWLNLWARLIPDHSERKHIFDMLAYKVQHPNVKINHALLLAGGHGIGKDTVLAPFLYAIGGPQARNISIVKNDELTSRWGYALESEVMLINELRQSEAKDRRALENTLKPIIAAPPERLSVERKGLHPYYALNRILVIAYSNERAAIALPSEDRRWFVVWSEAEKLDGGEALHIWNWYKSGGASAVARWLLSRDVSAFNPSAAPPMTDAKLAMIVSSRSSAEEYLINLIQAQVGEFSRGVCVPNYATLDRIKGGFGGNPAAINKPALEHALREAGWRDCGMLHSREHLTKKHVFCAPELADAKRSELRRLAEMPPEPMALRAVG